MIDVKSWPELTKYTDLNWLDTHVQQQQAVGLMFNRLQTHTMHARERIQRVVGIKQNQSGAGHDDDAAEDLGTNPQTCS